MFEQFCITEYFISADSVIYIGTIENIKAVCTVPKLNVTPNFFQDSLKYEKQIIQQNDIYTTYSLKADITFDVRLTYPAPDSLLVKIKNKMQYKSETYEEYINTEHKMNLQWVDNILDETTSEKILFSNENHVIVADYKWNQAEIDRLNLLLIFKNKKYKTIRDVDDVKLLVEAKKSALHIAKSFGLNPAEVVMFFHYPPTYYQLHLHIVNIKNRFTQSLNALRARLIDDVIYNISLDPSYYKRDMFFGGFVECDENK